MPWEHYLLPLLDYRIGVEWNVERGRLLSWAVQLEWLDPEEGRFVWVARYDTAGGLPHRDRNRIARHEPMPHLSPTSGGDLNRARDDLLARAWEYIEAYKAAKAEGREAW